MKDQVVNKKIQIGSKLITCNAVWAGLDEPFVLPASSFPPNCGIKLHGNSTRRARSYVKLGYQYNNSPFPVALKSLSPTGGIAPLLDVIVNVSEWLFANFSFNLESLSTSIYGDSRATK